MQLLPPLGAWLDRYLRLSLLVICRSAHATSGELGLWMRQDKTTMLDTIAVYDNVGRAHNSQLGTCCGQRTWIGIAADNTTLDAIAMCLLSTYLIAVFVLYACFSINIGVVIFLKEIFTPLTIWLIVCSNNGPVMGADKVLCPFLKF